MNPKIHAASLLARTWRFLLAGGIGIMFVLAPLSALAFDGPLVVETTTSDSFVLAAAGRAPTILYDPADAKVVAHAAADLAKDLAAVADAKARVATGLGSAGRQIIVVGALGKNRIIDGLVAKKKLDVGALRGSWESFLITTVDHPVAGVDRALVIVGSDRRGAAYGVYELSAAMGVSPWAWWADVAPAKKPTLAVPAGVRRFGPPSVRYRGVFINDEDWGLFPWAARTHDPARGNIGPKTYARVFELLLRLKANTLWPAMHKTSAAFNSDPANARLADDYGIVMGSSHAEPMLRNNVGEWNGPAADFNYATNPKGVSAYWEERVKTNAPYETLWTLGMRGIHDSGIVGADTPADQVALLDRIITDQRALLRKRVEPNLKGVQQIFVPYKEVLDIYRNGLRVPEDVTLVWPDDNHGYIRQFPNQAERSRAGGAGVYYHLSYLGAPLAYLWLSTTPPALIQEEMTRAYDRGIRSVWIANVGDIKPAEIETSLFLEMAWDIDQWRGRSQRAYLDDWAGRAFGETKGEAIGTVLDDYYRLNFERRPEFLQSPVAQGDRPAAGAFTPAEADRRLKRFSALVDAAATAGKQVPPILSNAYFELVDYPVRASAAANRRFFGTQRYVELIDTDPAMARSAGAVAVAADNEVKALTQRFNGEIAGGKWRYIMSEEPADAQWRSFRASRVALPAEGLVTDPGLFLAKIAATRLDTPNDVFEAEDGGASAGWRFVEGLGRGRGVMAARGPDARLTFTVTIPEGAPRGLEVALLPLFPDAGETRLSLEVMIDGGAPRAVGLSRVAGDKAWSQGVLDNMLRLGLAENLAPGAHEVVLAAKSSGIMVDRLMLTAPRRERH
jgi:hypothetical protein